MIDKLTETNISIERCISKADLRFCRYFVEKHLKTSEKFCMEILQSEVLKTLSGFVYSKYSQNFIRF